MRATGLPDRTVGPSPQPQPGTAQPSRATASDPAARTRIFSSRGHVRLPRCLPPHALLPTAPCAMLRFCPAHSALHTHIWRSKGGARCSVAAVKTRRRRARTLRRCCGLFRLRFVSSLFPLAIFWSFVVFGKTDRDVVTGETNFSRQGGDRQTNFSRLGGDGRSDGRAVPG